MQHFNLWSNLSCDHITYENKLLVGGVSSKGVVARFKDAAIGLELETKGTQGHLLQLLFLLYSDLEGAKTTTLE